MFLNLSRFFMLLLIIYVHICTSYFIILIILIISPNFAVSSEGEPNSEI